MKRKQSLAVWSFTIVLAVILSNQLFAQNKPPMWPYILYKRLGQQHTGQYRPHDMIVNMLDKAGPKMWARGEKKLSLEQRQVAFAKMYSSGVKRP